MNFGQIIERLLPSPNLFFYLWKFSCQNLNAPVTKVYYLESHYQSLNYRIIIWDMQYIFRCSLYPCITEIYFYAIMLEIPDNKGTLVVLFAAFVFLFCCRKCHFNAQLMYINWQSIEDYLEMIFRNIILYNTYVNTKHALRKILKKKVFCKKLLSNLAVCLCSQKTWKLASAIF